MGVPPKASTIAPSSTILAWSSSAVSICASSASCFFASAASRSSSLRCWHASQMTSAMPSSTGEPRSRLMITLREPVWPSLPMKASSSLESRNSSSPLGPGSYKFIRIELAITSLNESDESHVSILQPGIAVPSCPLSNFSAISRPASAAPSASMPATYAVSAARPPTSAASAVRPSATACAAVAAAMKASSIVRPSLRTSACIIT
mmetsp:Transcript_44099/g.129976  ORF Transcript_44099/g.129976 Transcript_44099/m.129976 type:complete len:206 (-) Transcript_44099:66-683(-)